MFRPCCGSQTLLPEWIFCISENTPVHWTNMDYGFPMFENATSNTDKVKNRKERGCSKTVSQKLSLLNLSFKQENPKDLTITANTSALQHKLQQSRVGAHHGRDQMLSESRTFALSWEHCTLFHFSVSKRHPRECKHARGLCQEPRLLTLLHRGRREMGRSKWDR